jgi:branched-chain amino acid transport system ATP-binding protein
MGREQYLLARGAETRYSFEVPIALAAKGVARSFRGFRALDGVDLTVEEGEIHAILGPNGAGKTTLFNCLSGVLQPTEGSVELFGEPITGLPPNQIVRKGLSRSFQISSVFESLTVLENIVVALQAKTHHPIRFWESHTVLDEFHPRAREILKQVHLEGKEQVRAADLSHGQKRNLEIGISLTQDPRVLLLDEPTSGMGREDVERTVQLGREVAKGRTVVLVEHNMGVVAQLAHRITVLARGQVLARGTYDEVRSDPRVVEAYLGEPQ